MIRSLRDHVSLFLTIVLWMMCVNVAFADKAVSDLTGEDRERFDKFRRLFTTGSTTEFYSYAKDYEAYLKEQGDMNLYYKLRNNEGFFALRHNQVLQAMEIAQDLEKEVRENKATDYYYLPMGLMGDVYYVSHDMRKAEKFFLQALHDVGDRDPKFTMRMYMSLGEMQALKAPAKALEWMDKALLLAEQQDNMEYRSMSVALKGYIHFLSGDAEKFFVCYDQYQNLKGMGDPDFSKRYANVMNVAKSAFDRDFKAAMDDVKRGNLYVDSSLVAIRVLALQGNVADGFRAMRDRYVELDSIYSLSQEASYDHIATERTIQQLRSERDESQAKTRRLTYWLIGLIVGFAFVYIMGRRRLMLKIWERNKDLKEAMVKAQEADKMKSAFIRNMSHEIRTPLNAVAGFSQLISNPDVELGEEEKADMRQRIADNVEGITAIVDELLELSKSESEAAIVSCEQMSDVRCNDLCRSVMRSMADKCHKGVQLRFSSGLKDDFTLRTDSNKMMRILMHLLGNAQKFTEQGHITVRTELVDRDRKLQISVTDTGVGIAEKDREMIFETFSKVDSFKEGIGLGLPICLRLAMSIGGTVSLDTTYTEGSRFLVTIPLHLK